MNRPILDPLDMGDLEDWGAKPNPIEGSPHEHGKIVWGSEDGPFEVGVWECTPGKWNTAIGANEFCHIVKGHWRLTHESGEIVDLKEGDSVFLENGWTGVGEAVSTVRKVYSISRVARTTE
jgi:uncharacterized cupin superfamily protein